MQFETLGIEQAQVVTLGLRGLVDDLEQVDVLDLALGVFAEQAAVLITSSDTIGRICRAATRAPTISSRAAA